MANIRTKRTTATVDFVVDWTLWLATGDTISTVAWSVGAGITQVTTTYTTTTAAIFLSGGTDGFTYDVTCTITTAQGRIQPFHFQIKVKIP